MKSLDKVDSPPAAENWARLQNPAVERTAVNIFNFVRGGPIWNYLQGKRATKYHIEDGIDRTTAVKIAGMKGSPLGVPHNIDLVHAFFDYVERHTIDGVRAFDEMVEFFPLRRGVSIPIRPLAVVRMQRHFTPYFLCPWSQIAFDEYQKRLFMTVLEKAIFTLTDFEDSPGRVLFFPKRHSGKDKGKRYPVIWERGSVPLLSDNDLNEQIRVFFEGKRIAKQMLRELMD